MEARISAGRTEDVRREVGMNRSPILIAMDNSRKINRGVIIGGNFFGYAANNKVGQTAGDRASWGRRHDSRFILRRMAGYGQRNSHGVHGLLRSWKDDSYAEFLC